MEVSVPGKNLASVTFSELHFILLVGIAQINEVLWHPIHYQAHHETVRSV